MLLVWKLCRCQVDRTIQFSPFSQPRTLFTPRYTRELLSHGVDPESECELPTRHFLSKCYYPFLLKKTRQIVTLRYVHILKGFNFFSLPSMHLYCASVYFPVTYIWFFFWLCCVASHIKRIHFLKGHYRDFTWYCKKLFSRFCFVFFVSFILIRLMCHFYLYYLRAPVIYYLYQDEQHISYCLNDYDKGRKNIVILFVLTVHYLNDCWNIFMLTD